MGAYINDPLAHNIFRWITPDTVNDRMGPITDVSNTTNDANGEVVMVPVRRFLTKMIYASEITVADDALGQFVAPTVSGDLRMTRGVCYIAHNVASGTSNLDFCGRVTYRVDSAEKTSSNDWGSSGALFEANGTGPGSGTAATDGSVRAGADYVSDTESYITMNNRTGVTADFTIWFL